jgi:hypothetical protein
MVELNRDEMIKTRILKARFDDVVINELALQAPINLTEVLKQIDVLWANADQSPRDAQRANMLLEFIDDALPQIVNSPNVVDDETRDERHIDKMQRDGEPHLDMKALRNIDK